MRFSEPRMIFYRPVTAIRHVIAQKEKRNDWRKAMANIIKRSIITDAHA